MNWATCSANIYRIIRAEAAAFPGSLCLLYMMCVSAQKEENIFVM